MNRKGMTEFNGNRIKLTSALAEQFVDVLPNGRKKWAFTYGPIVLGIYDERKKLFLRAKSRKTVNHVLR